MKRSKTELATMESRAVKVALYLALGSFAIPFVLVFTSVALGQRPYSKNPLIDALIDCFVGWLLLAPPVLFWYLVFALAAFRFPDSHSNTTKPESEQLNKNATTANKESDDV